MLAQEPTFEALLETIRNKTCNSTLEIEQKFNDEMIMQIAVAIPENSNLLSLTLRPRRVLLGVEVISTAATKTLIHTIITRTSLESLDLGFQLEKGGAEAIAILLQHSTTLRALYLGSTDAIPIGGGNARNPSSGHPSIGDTGVVVLAKALDQNPKSSLDSFCLRHNWFGEEGAEALANALCKIPSFKNLTLLHCMIGSEIFDSKGARGLVPLFQRSKTLEEANLFGNDIDDESVVALINALNQNPNSNLKIWNLGRNKIRKRGIIALATFLKHNPPLEALYLKANEFHKRAEADIGLVPMLFGLIIFIVGGLAVREGLVTALTYAFPSRRTSDIDELSTAIAMISVSLIPFALPYLTSILKRRRNNIDKKEIVELAHSLTLNNTLKILDLSSTDIRDLEAIAFAQALDPLNPNQQSILESLNLRFTMIGDLGATAFARILPRNRSLVTLNLADNAIGNPSGKALLEALTHDSIWNTPLLSISLGRTPGGFFRGPNQIDEQTKQSIDSIDSILQRKHDISQRQAVPWSAASFCIAFVRANSTSPMRECVLDLVPEIGRFLGFSFPPRLMQTKPEVLPPKDPNSPDEPPAFGLHRRNTHQR